MECLGWVLLTDHALRGVRELAEEQAKLAREAAGCAPEELRCDTAQGPAARACEAVPMLPAMCHRGTGLCFAGVVETREDFAQLARRVEAQAAQRAA